MKLALFLAKRLLRAVFVVWASVTVLFAIFYVLPGDRADQVMGGDRLLDDRTRALVVADLGLDQPTHVQYTKLWANLASGDLGSSYVSGASVSDVLGSAAPASLRLAFWALVIEIVVAVGAALWIAARGSRTSQWVSIGVTTLLLSVPVFLTGYLLQYVFGILPFRWGLEDAFRPAVQGMGPDSWAGLVPTGEQWRYLVLPALTLALLSGAVLHRIAFQAGRNCLDAPWVDGLKSRGISSRRIFAVHVLRNAIGPVLAFLSIDIVALFGSAIITEAVFGWPGVGGEMAKALERADAPVIFGLAIVIAIAYVVSTFVFETLHRLVDPRIGGLR